MNKHEFNRIWAYPQPDEVRYILCVLNNENLVQGRYVPRHQRWVVLCKVRCFSVDWKDLQIRDDKGRNEINVYFGLIKGGSELIFDRDTQIVVFTTWHFIHLCLGFWALTITIHFPHAAIQMLVPQHGLCLDSQAATIVCTDGYPQMTGDQKQDQRYGNDLFQQCKYTKLYG